MKKLKKWISGFHPRAVPSSVAAVVFSAAALVIVARENDHGLPEAAVSIVYVCAAVSLTFAVWSITLAVRSASLKERLHSAAQKTGFTSKLMADYSFRTITMTYGTLVTDILLALMKAVAGWYFVSTWLMVLAGYYAVLCVARFLLLRNNRRLAALSDERDRRRHEFRAYRISGVLLIVMTAALQGVVVLIVREGKGFFYHGTLVFAVALYDFYCLTRAVVYMAGTRKIHSPVLISIKTFSFASALVAMLSLQTAMFASFGSDIELSIRRLMNALTGSAVCLILLATGVCMVIRANRQLRRM
ncbi:hypothetical protein ACRQU7_16015 [Caproiciproducens sp. R1]|uniref:hypothetical protein n=1 Tax=Caproiciproducens sp. R1 TaxID=3435000 RepID=UPI004034BF13